MEHNSILSEPEAHTADSRRSVRIGARAAIIAVAVAVGAILRFYRLGALQLSADEGASWAAADAPSISAVIATQATHNAGKLPFHDLLLHGWIALFGDGLFAMRSLSVLLGIVALILVASATDELIRAGPGDDQVLAADPIRLAGPLASLFCAVSIVFIKYDEQARMYSLMLAAILAQLWFFLRTLRTRAISDAGALAILTAAATASSLVVAPMLATEGIWALWTMLRGRIRSALTAGFGVIAGLAALAPALYRLAATDIPMVREGIVNWLVMPPWWEPAAFFSKALGSFAFPVFAILAVVGCIWNWTRIKEGLEFALLWMWAPPILLVLGSHLWRPMFVERYALYSFVPVFILAALGACAIRSDRARVVAVVIAVGFALGHVNSYWRRPHDTDWAAAARTARGALAPGQTVAVLPGYAVEALRYYLPPATRQFAVRGASAENSQIVVVADQLHQAAMVKELERTHPHRLGRLRGVVVFAR